MGHSRHVHCSDPEPRATVIPPVVHDILVTGTPNPEVNGIYDQSGTKNGKPRYLRTDTTYSIAWDSDIEAWCFFSYPAEDYQWFIREDPSVYGQYEPAGGSGFPTVSLWT